MNKHVLSAFRESSRTDTTNVCRKKIITIVVPWKERINWKEGIEEFFFFFFFLTFIHLLFLRERGRERENTQAGDGQREREGDTESKASSRLRAVSTEPHAGLELTDQEIMT